MKYRHKYMPMKAIGELFGITSHQLGKLLIKIGLREKDGKPSNRAYNERFIEQRFFNMCYTNYWHTEQTIAELLKDGLKLIPNPPMEYIDEYDPVEPPFSFQKNNCNGYAIMNKNGSTVFTAYCEEDAIGLVKYLNAGSKYPNFYQFFPER